MRFGAPNRVNDRKVRSEYRTLNAGQQHRERPQAKSGWLSTVGRALRDNAALIAALPALVGVLVTQVVTTNNAREGLKAQQDLEEERAREAELQTYLNDMGEMLLDEDSPLPDAEPEGPMSSLARAKTLTILERLDGERERIVLQFLQESQLIRSEEIVVSLRGANLSGADLSDANMIESSLSGADLRNAILSDAILSGADLRNAILIEGDLSDAILVAADLSGADLSRVRGVTTEELEASALSLSGTTMPDGSIHP